MSAVTDEMVEAALPSYSEGGCSGLDERERREVVRDILEAGFALLPAQTEPDAGRVEEAAPQADLVTESEVYAALGGWQKAIIDAPEEGVEERRRRCMRAALKAARACSSAQSRQNTPPSPPREEIEHQGVVAVGVKG